MTHVGRDAVAVRGSRVLVKFGIRQSHPSWLRYSILSEEFMGGFRETEPSYGGRKGD